MANDPLQNLIGQDVVLDFGRGIKPSQETVEGVEESASGDPIIKTDELMGEYPESQFEDAFVAVADSGESQQTDTPNPMEVHESRSKYAQRQDEARDARLTTDPEKYASDPNSYDFAGVDTGPKFSEEFGDVDFQDFL